MPCGTANPADPASGCGVENWRGTCVSRRERDGATAVTMIWGVDCGRKSRHAPAVDALGDIAKTVSPLRDNLLLPQGTPQNVVTSVTAVTLCYVFAGCSLFFDSKHRNMGVIPGFHLQRFPISKETYKIAIKSQEMRNNAMKTRRNDMNPAVVRKQPQIRRNIQARLPEGSLKKREQGRSKNGQASREDIFPPLAGAKAPDPNAACGRMVAATEP